MDIKLGTVLYDALAPITDKKKARMIEAARKTTTKDTGIRITGFKVCRHFARTVQVKKTLSFPGI